MIYFRFMNKILKFWSSNTILQRNVSNVKYFDTKFDRYDGLHMEINANHNVKIDVNQLSTLINDNLLEAQKKIRTIWFNLNSMNAYLIEPLIKLGFKFHHTKNDHIILYKSLIDHNNIPKYAYTNVGVGGLVVNNHNEILVVKERAKITNYWKFPGGYVEQSEELYDACEREIYEETGIQTKFQCILAFRHLHNVGWGFDCSDLYFVCYLKSLDTNNDTDDDNSNEQNIVKCPKEIDQCKWMNINEIDGKLSRFNHFIVEKFVEWQKSDREMNFTQIQTEFPKPLNKFNVYSMMEKKKFI